MLVSELITELQKFPGTAQAFVMAADWYPKAQMPVSFVIDALGNKTPTVPLLLIYGGPNGFQSYDATGYQFTNA